MGHSSIHAARGRARLDARLDGTLERGRLGLGLVEPARELRRARQWAQRCGLRRFPRSKARPRNARIAPVELITLPDAPTVGGTAAGAAHSLPRRRRLAVFARPRSAIGRAS